MTDVVVHNSVCLRSKRVDAASRIMRPRGSGGQMEGQLPHVAELALSNVADGVVCNQVVVVRCCSIAPVPAKRHAYGPKHQTSARGQSNTNTNTPVYEKFVMRLCVMAVNAVDCASTPHPS